MPAQQPPSALVVDTDPLFVSQQTPIIGACGYRCIPVTQFVSARYELYACRPDILIANIRLGAFNGIHLAYLAKINRRDTRILIYGSEDPMLAAEIQTAGAFYERPEFVLFSLAGFLQARLPERDRRDVCIVDRRAIFRGGRRTTDIPVLHSGAAV